MLGSPWTAVALGSPSLDSALATSTGSKLISEKAAPRLGVGIGVGVCERGHDVCERGREATPKLVSQEDERSTL
jgi:hypothetical protein